MAPIYSPSSVKKLFLFICRELWMCAISPSDSPHYDHSDLALITTEIWQ